MQEYIKPFSSDGRFAKNENDSIHYNQLHVIW